jgi:phosphate transport system substrate-binding protein
VAPPDWLRIAALAGTVALAAGPLSGCGGTATATATGAGPAPGSVIVSGGGAQVAYPIYEEIGSLLSGRGITLNYQLSGIPAAMSMFRRGELTFVAGTGAGAARGLPRLGTTSTMYVPVGFAAVAVIYNLPSVQSAIRLDAKTLAAIFRGAVRNWNSPQIARQNPGVRLPPSAILVVHRSDPTLTNALLTQYMAAGSASWRHAVGSGAQIAWPGGTPASSDVLMQQEVSQNAGAIGYTDQATALQDGFQTARLRNPSGAYVAPSLAATSAIGAQPHASGQLALQTVDAHVAGAYPVASEQYLLTYRDPCDAGLVPRQARAAQQFLDYTLAEGQSVLRRLFFAPLPPGLLAHARAEVGGLTCDSQTVASL